MVILVCLANELAIADPHSCPLVDAQTEWMSQLGPTMNLRIFWEDVILTAEPENIKVRRNHRITSAMLISVIYRQF